MIMSSVVMRNMLVISRFAEKLFPLPGVPKIKPFDLLDILLSQISVEEYIKFYEANTTNINARK